LGSSHLAEDNCAKSGLIVESAFGTFLFTHSIHPQRTEMKPIVALIFFSILFSAGSFAQKNAARQFLDLSVGNNWNYARLRNGRPENYTMKISVNDSTASGFAIVEERLTHDTAVSSQLNMFRADSSGNIYMRIFNFDSLKRIPTNARIAKDAPRDGTSIWYKFNAKSGEKWIAYGQSPKQKTVIQKYEIQLVSNSATVTYKGQKYAGCFEFRFSPVGASGCDTYEWIALNEGIVRKKIEQTKSDYYLMWKRLKVLGVD
jgi:hypothetical protein